MERATLYQEAIERRRAFRLRGYATLADLGHDGPWVSPIQKICGNLSGPMLVSKDWLDGPSARKAHARIAEQGHVPGMLYMKIIDAALALVGLSRAQIYVTPVFCLLPQRRSSVIPAPDRAASFEAVGQYELLGRRPIALGRDAAQTLRGFGVACLETRHPSARGQAHAARAQEIASALEAA